MVSLLKIPRSFYKLQILLSLKYGLLWPFTDVFWFLILIFSLWSHKIHFLVMFFHMAINIAAKFLVYSLDITSLETVLKTLFYRNFLNFTLFWCRKLNSAWLKWQTMPYSSWLALIKEFFFFKKTQLWIKPCFMVFG